MKKLVVGSALAVGLLLSGAGQSPVSASSIEVNASSLGTIDLQSMDLETALLTVQSQRANLLDSQLSNQLAEVQARNAEIGALNDHLNSLNAEMAQSNDEDKKAELDKEINATRAQIDAASNAQQMEMLRLQSLSNKRNEAFDVMTNFLKKMQDSQSSISGNLR